MLKRSNKITRYKQVNKTAQKIKEIKLQWIDKMNEMETKGFSKKEALN